MTSNDVQPSSADKEDLGFEDAFRQLTEIAERLEAGGLTLAEATERYEQGMKLVQFCNRLLDTAELEITTLRENYQRPQAAPSQEDGIEPPFFDDGTFEEVIEDEDEPPF